MFRIYKLDLVWVIQDTILWADFLFLVIYIYLCFRQSRVGKSRIKLNWEEKNRLKSRLDNKKNWIRVELSSRVELNWVE